MLHGFQLHLVGKGPFAGQDIFTLEVAVNHDDRGGIIVQVADNDRHGLHTGDLTGMVAAVSSNQFVSTVWVRPGNRRNQYAVLPDAFGGVCHRFIILDFERVVLKGVELRQRDFHDFFPVFIGAAFFRRKQVIDRCQLYIFRAAFQFSEPPSSDFDKPRPPCRRGHGHRCFSPRRWSPWRGPNGEFPCRIH